MLFDSSPICINFLEDDLFIRKKVSVSILRLDKIHPVVSGNKLFKLHFFLKEALSAGHKTITSFGGAYSNHLVATAYACRLSGLNSVGIVRGDRPPILSHTLQECSRFGMQLKFITRKDYGLIKNGCANTLLQNEFSESTIIPEGGYHPLGAKGAALIMGLFNKEKFSHICTATGTATTLAGLLLAAGKGQSIVGIPVLKGITDMPERIRYLAGITPNPDQLHLLHQYHFGGYAKRTTALLQFMNRCWKQFQLPLDFVYTAKMFYGVMESIKNDHYPAGSNILCLHTGGIQGNGSLPEGSLLYP